jgi:hypothetical protein
MYFQAILKEAVTFNRVLAYFLSVPSAAEPSELMALRAAFKLAPGYQLNSL